MIPILIDGWSTNWKVLKLLEEKYNDREYALLMNIGSCVWIRHYLKFGKNYESNRASLSWLSWNRRCVYQNMWKWRVSFEVIFYYWVFNIFLYMNFCCFKIWYINSFSCFLCKLTNLFCCMKLLAYVHILLIYCFVIFGKISGSCGLL